MKGESYYRQLDQRGGNHRPGIRVGTPDSPFTPSPPMPRRKPRNPVDTGLKILAGVLIWSGVSLALFAVYAVVVMLLRGR